LGSDPEIPDYAERAAGGQLPHATSRAWTGQDGQRQEKTEWHSIVAWGKLADICERYPKQGKTGLRGGRLETRSWQDKEGTAATRRRSSASRCRCWGVRCGSKRRSRGRLTFGGRGARRVDGAGQRRLRRRFAVLATSLPVGRGCPTYGEVTECSRVSGASRATPRRRGSGELFACPFGRAFRTL